MKSLANCTPTEFLKQTVAIKKPLEKWLKDTGIPEIRKRKPAGFDKMTSKQKEAALVEQGQENLADMLAAAMEHDPESTLRVMGLCCFTDYEDIDSHPMAEYLETLLEMIGNEAVRSFFMLYLKSAHLDTSEE